MSRYCLDSSGILDGWKRYYPTDIFPALESYITGLAAEGKVLIPQDIVNELKKLDDAASRWAGRLKGCHVVPDRSVQDKVTEILSKFPRLVGSGNGRSAGDPWVIATAAVHEAFVVTGEQGGSENKPKIPFVCECLGIRCFTFTELLRREGWRFVRDS